ncbi:glycoside hydrolase family 16 protein [Bradyrhizobium manausense]|uniref:glycoside hydrolase family 16 protein n=1 Tax=Bradyrhizobium manausense TaxID=989370 RepID=UPI001BA86031|nr:glycoside hydrolase family 16 protein [Bradyrhizobium manausense]MBR1092283.1 glycoside hydrolase family 16 protein [Bradyrhizobium manausense]
MRLSARLVAAAGIAFNLPAGALAQDVPMVQSSCKPATARIVDQPKPTGGSAIPVTPDGTHAMHLTLDEEFKQLDRKVWTTAVRPANAGEQQVYLDSEVELGPKGGLRLRARREQAFGKRFVAGAISSVMGFAQLYGHFEIKAKLPKGAGLWPAFWLLPLDQTWPPEIDVFEFLGRQPRSLYQSFHWRTPAGNGQKVFDSGPLHNIDFSDSYHVFAVDWRPEFMVFSIDGKESWRATEKIPDKAMYLIANLALGGGWAGSPPDDLGFPVYLDIAYIRAFQYDDLADREPAIMEFGPTEIQMPGPESANAKFVGVLRTGRQDLDQATVHLWVQDAAGEHIFYHSYTRLSHLGGSGAYAYCINIPTANLAADTYGIKLAAFTQNKKIFLALANRLVVAGQDKK